MTTPELNTFININRDTSINKRSKSLEKIRALQSIITNLEARLQIAQASNKQLRAHLSELDALLGIQEQQQQNKVL